MKDRHQHRWNIDECVLQLRNLRNQAALKYNFQSACNELPSNQELKEIVNALISVLFPNFTKVVSVREEAVDYFIGYNLEVLLQRLYEQVCRELSFDINTLPTDEKKNRAFEIVHTFASRLPSIRALIDSDVQAAFEKDPAARSPTEVLLCYPGITAIMLHRFANVLYQQGVPLIARMMSEIGHSMTGIDIHPGAQIGESFFIDHGTGVVIGETTIIGKNVRLYHAVTLGAKSFRSDDKGILFKGEARHPIIEDDVVIYAGATILGRITIGRGSVIGGNVWLTHSVPANSVISQARVRSELFYEGAGI